MLAAAVFVGILAAPASAPSSPAAALSRLAALAGDWKGTFEWTGARTDRGELAARYSTTGYAPRSWRLCSRTACRR